jgi:hypothetical protein
MDESASQGVADSAQVNGRAIARPGEVLENVPGMIITQHSGGGKANQYYLRGFDLDHGTDFATYVDGVPINLPTHAHGQGYTDINWVIPELVRDVTFEKGVYYADQGDFANAGAANIRYVDRLPESLAKAEAGGLGFYRGLGASSTQLGGGSLLYAFEAMHDDGAWEVPGDYRKFNGLVKYAVGDERWGYDIAAQGYYGIWRANDQVPERAIDEGLIDRFGSLDPSTGGNTHRYSLYANWHRRDEQSSTQVDLYAVQYNLDLFSDFTYFLDQVNGDEIEQKDSRVYAGARARHTFYGKLAGFDTENTLGFQTREDAVIATLNHMDDRALVQHYRTDDVSELNLAPWYENKIRWNDWLRTVAGVRADLFLLSDQSDTAANSGSEGAGIISPKLSFVFGPWARTEYYLQAGYGFRTNDARGVFSTVSPQTDAASPQLAPIIGTRGAEAGIRTGVISNLQSTLSLWSLWSASDTFFDGDVGAVVDAQRPGVRYGVEWNNAYRPCSWLLLDADFAYSWARFTDGNTAVGLYIPDSITSSISAGVTVRDLPALPGFFGSLRLRQFGPRPLIEDGSEESAPSSVFNLLAGYGISRNLTVSIEVLNLFDAAYNDAEYFYSSRLLGEPAGPDDGGGTNDHMIHAGEPRSLRATLAARF